MIAHQMNILFIVILVISIHHFQFCCFFVLRCCCVFILFKYENSHPPSALLTFSFCIIQLDRSIYLYIEIERVFSACVPGLLRECGIHYVQIPVWYLNKHSQCLIWSLISSILSSISWYHHHSGQMSLFLARNGASLLDNMWSTISKRSCANAAKSK